MKHEKNRMVKIFHPGLGLLALLVIFISGCGLVYDEEKLLASAAEHQKKGDHQAAVIEYKKVLQKNPDNKQARLHIAKSYLVLKKGDVAEKELRRAIKLGENKNDVIVDLAQSLLLQNNFKDIFSETPIDASLTGQPRARLQMIHGYAYFAQQEADKARAMFEAATQDKEVAVSAYIGLSELAVATGDNKTALAEISKAINIDNANSDAWFQRGKINLVMGDRDEAKRSFNNVIKVSPKNMMSKSEFQARKRLAQISLGEKDINAAKEQIAVMERHAPNNHDTRYMKALMAYQNKDYDQARTHLEHVAANMPDFGDAQFLMGAIYFAQGHMEQADETISRYLVKVPSHIQARKLLATIRMKSGRHQDALDTLKEAGNPARDAELLNMIGQAALMSNDTEQFVTILKKAKQENPQNQVLREELAKLYMKQGSFDAAIDELEGISDNKSQKSKERLIIFALVQKQEFGKARSKAKQLMQTEKNSAESLTIAGTVELAAGDRITARKFYNQVLESMDNHLPAIMQLARMDMEDGQLAAAERGFRKILELDGKNVTAMMGMADLSGRKNMPEEAVTWLNTAIQKNPRAITPRLLLSRFYFATQKQDKAVTLLEEAEKIEPKNRSVLVMLSRAKLSIGRKEEALVIANKLVSATPDDPGAYIELARIQNMLNDKSKAQQSLQKALKINPKFLPANIALASFHLKYREFAEASRVIEVIKREQPKAVIGYALEGDLYLAQQKYADAVKAFTAAYRLKSVAEIMRKLSISQQLAGDSQGSIKTLNDWLTQHPKDDSARFDLAIVYEKSGKADKAIAIYQSILKEHPDNVAALNNLSLVYMASDKNKALDYAEKVYKLKGEVPAVADTYGWILVELGKLDEAAPILAKAAAKSNNPSIQYHHAVLLSKKGDKAAAKMVLDKIVNLKGDYPEKKAARELYNQISK
ncbi:MAG: PEP-CTERM system TPR-repeat protein PrsT [Gammaproteobacteria bacterium]|nr:PEP-CTERM system TPR-repeat protein PrsT [Gammaproteobacteria bacterium]MDH5652389.1 PEP-CTERM system TPR-repeat protein PrsT [Gammaproteobacteria bacterium]